MPMPTSDYCNSKEEAEQITLTRNVIKEFGTAVQENLKQLVTYIKDVISSKPLLKNFTQSCESKTFNDFKQLLLSAPGTTLVPNKVEHLIKETFNNMQDDYAQTL